MNVDFARAKLLMDVIEAAGKHGLSYSSIGACATAELQQMVEKLKNKEWGIPEQAPEPKPVVKPPLPNQAAESDNWREKLAKERNEMERKV